MALHGLDKIKIPNRTYDNPDLRHELRMKPFLRIGYPALPSWSDLNIGREQGNLEIPFVEIQDVQADKDGWSGMLQEKLDAVLKVKPSVLGRSHSLESWEAELKAYDKAIHQVQSVSKMLLSVLDPAQRSLTAEQLKVTLPPPEERAIPFLVIPKVEII